MCSGTNVLRITIAMSITSTMSRATRHNTLRGPKYHHVARGVNPIPTQQAHSTSSGDLLYQVRDPIPAVASNQRSFNQRRDLVREPKERPRPSGNRNHHHERQKIINQPAKRRFPASFQLSLTRLIISNSYIGLKIY